jgi:AcrR family transcriptional regulator
MQYKKDELRLALLNEARNEFLEKGFIQASVRQIAKRAGTTIGNFYHYYGSKEAIFDALVGDAHEKFQWFIQHHNETEAPAYLQGVTDPVIWRQALKEFASPLMQLFTDAFLLLLACSEGTRHQSARESLKNVLAEHFTEHMNELQRAELPAWVLAHNELVADLFITGVVRIMKEQADTQVRENMLIEHLLFTFLGAMGVMGFSLTGEPHK